MLIDKFRKVFKFFILIVYEINYENFEYLFWNSFGGEVFVFLFFVSW